MPGLPAAKHDRILFTPPEQKEQEMESPKLSPEDASAIALIVRQHMAFLSREQWAAGWFIEWEYKLWRQIHAGQDQEMAALGRLAKLCGGWWMKREDGDGEAPNDDPYRYNLKFVPLDEWRNRYNAWLADREP